MADDELESNHSDAQKGESAPDTPDRSLPSDQIVIRIIDRLVWPITIAAFWFPFQPVARMIHDLAGKETTIDVKFLFTLSIILTVTTGAAVLEFLLEKRKNKVQRDELKRLRDRISLLEKERDELRKERDELITENAKSATVTNEG